MNNNVAKLAAAHQASTPVASDRAYAYRTTEIAHAANLCPATTDNIM